MKKLLILAALVTGVAAVPTGIQHASAGGAPASNFVCKDQNIPSGTYLNITVPAGYWCDIDGTGIVVQGSVQAASAIGLGIGGGTIIWGNVQVSKINGNDPYMSGTSNYICNSVIKGNVQIVNSTSNSNWNIGVNDPTLGPDSCTGGGSFVGRNFQFNNNQGTTNEISNNDVEGSAQCIGGTTPTGGPNGADGNINCSPVFASGDAGGEPQAANDGDGAD